MGRTILAIVIGYAAWTAIWLGGNAAFFGDAADVVGKGEKYVATTPLVAIIGLSLVCSVVAGWVTAKISRSTARRDVMILAILLLATGIFVQSAVWSLMPIWYHLTFLALVVPVVVMSGRVAQKS